VLTDVTTALPFRDGAFAAVLALNTFEHLGNDRAALGECVRVLRAGGSLHLMTPFLWRVHGDPDDFHRHTASAWAAMLRTAGATDIQIEPLVWDPFASAWAIADMAPLGRTWWRARRFIRPAVLARPLLLGRVDKRQRADADALTAEYALAYYTTARRP
jgi:SAM-dependent methyltransferase